MANFDLPEGYYIDKDQSVTPEQLRKGKGRYILKKKDDPSFSKELKGVTLPIGKYYHSDKVNRFTTEEVVQEERHFPFPSHRMESFLVQAPYGKSSFSSGDDKIDYIYPRKQRLWYSREEPSSPVTISSKKLQSTNIPIANRYSQEISEKAMLKGTAIHAQVSEWIKNGTKPTIPEAQLAIGNLTTKYKRKEGWKYLADVPVTDLRKYASEIDILAYNKDTNETVIIDLKTGKAYGKEHAAQLSMYEAMWNRLHPNQKITKTEILHTAAAYEKNPWKSYPRTSPEELKEIFYGGKFQNFVQRFKNTAKIRNLDKEALERAALGDPLRYSKKVSNGEAYDKNTYTVLDIETGGKTEPVAVTAIKYARNLSTGAWEVQDTFERYYDFDLRSGKDKKYYQAAAVHGLTPEIINKLRGLQKAKYSKTWNDKERNALLEFIGTQSKVVGHNIWGGGENIRKGFDLPALFTKEQIKVLEENGGILDTLMMFEDLTGQTKGNTLDNLFKIYFGKTMEEAGLPHHDAMSDVIATAMIVKKASEENTLFGSLVKDALLPGVSYTGFSESEVFHKGGKAMRVGQEEDWKWARKAYLSDDPEEWIQNNVPEERRKMVSHIVNKREYELLRESMSSLKDKAKEKGGDVYSWFLEMDEPEDRAGVRRMYRLFNEVNKKEGKIENPQDLFSYVKAGEKEGVDSDKISKASVNPETMGPATRNPESGSAPWMSDITNLVTQKNAEEQLVAAQAKQMSWTASLTKIGELADTLKEYAGSNLLNNLSKKNTLALQAAKSEDPEAFLRDMSVPQELRNEILTMVPRQKNKWLNEEFTKIKDAVLSTKDPELIQWMRHQTKPTSKSELLDLQDTYRAEKNRITGEVAEAERVRDRREKLVQSYTDYGYGSKGREDLLQQIRGASNAHDLGIAENAFKFERRKEQAMENALQRGNIHTYREMQGATSDLDLDEIITNSQEFNAALSSMTSAVNTVTASLNKWPTESYQNVLRMQQNQVNGVLGAAQGIVPKDILAPFSRLSQSYMNYSRSNYADIQYRWDKLHGIVPMAKTGLTVAGGLIGGAVGGLPGAAIGTSLGQAAGLAVGGIANATESIITYFPNKRRERDVTKYGERIQGTLNIAGGAIDILSIPFKLLSTTTRLVINTFKTLQHDILRLGHSLRNISRDILRYSDKFVSLISSGLNLYNQMGSPLTPLTGVDYSSFEKTSYIDILTGKSSGTTNSAYESFAQAQQELYWNGRMNVNRVRSAALLGVFSDVYANGGDTEAQYANTVNTLYNNMKQNPGQRQFIMGQSSVIDSQIPQILTYMERAEKYLNTPVTYQDIQKAGTWGVHVRDITDDEATRFYGYRTERSLISKGINNTKMRFAGNMWNRFGRDIYNGINIALDRAVTALDKSQFISSMEDAFHALEKQDWRGVWSNTKEAFSSLIPYVKEGWEKIKPVFKEGWEKITDKFKEGWDYFKGKFTEWTSKFGIEISWDSLKQGLSSFFTFINDGFWNIISHVTKSFGYFIDYISTIRFHPEEFYKSLMGKDHGDIITGGYDQRPADMSKEDKRKLWSPFTKDEPVTNPDATPFTDRGNVWELYNVTTHPGFQEAAGMTRRGRFTDDVVLKSDYWTMLNAAYKKQPLRGIGSTTILGKTFSNEEVLNWWKKGSPDPNSSVEPDLSALAKWEAMKDLTRFVEESDLKGESGAQQLKGWIRTQRPDIGEALFPDEYKSWTPDWVQNAADTFNVVKEASKTQLNNTVSSLIDELKNSIINVSNKLDVNLSFTGDVQQIGEDTVLLPNGTEVTVGITGASPGSITTALRNSVRR